MPLDTFTVCNSPTAAFFSYSINGVPESYTAPAFDLIQSVSGNDMRVQIIGPLIEGIIVFKNPGIGLNSQQQINAFSPVNFNQLIPRPGDSVMVRITEYGPIGGYIAGHFSGNMVDAITPVGQAFTVQGSFRVLRNQ
jgi:hypothetical protein